MLQGSLLRPGIGLVHQTNVGTDTLLTVPLTRFTAQREERCIHLCATNLRKGTRANVRHRFEGGTGQQLLSELPVGGDEHERLLGNHAQPSIDG